MFSIICLKYTLWESFKKFKIWAYFLMVGGHVNVSKCETSITHKCIKTLTAEI